MWGACPIDFEQRLADDWASGERMPDSHQNLASLFLARARESGAERGILYRTEAGWGSLTYGEWARRSTAIARGLCRLGVQPGDHVMVVGKSTPEFLLMAWGVALAGAVLVPASGSLAHADFQEMLAQTEPQLLVLGTPGLLARFEALWRPREGRTVVLQTQSVQAETGTGARPFMRLEDVVSARDEVLSLDQLESFGKPGVDGLDLAARTAGRSLKDPAVIIHTAGTIGEQKSVVLTNEGLLYQARTLSFLLPVGPEDTQLLFLPLSHVLGFIAVLTGVAAGTPLALGDGMRTLLEDLRDVRPTFMVGVPRVYEKIVDKLVAGMRDFSGVWWEVYRRGLESGRKVIDAQADGRRPNPVAWGQLEIARRSVFSRCREIFGGRMRFLISGGAPIPDEVAYTILSYGIPLLNGFGLTEAAGASHLQRFEQIRVGTVGPALPMVQTRIAPDGEVLVKSPGIMQGYLGDPSATERAITKDGFLRTGDLGRIEADGCLRITGRRKNVLVTATGKNVVPGRLEGRLTGLSLVSHAMVVGDDRPYLAALVTVGTTRITQWANQNGILCENVQKLRTDIRLYQELERLIEAINKGLAPHERVRRFVILDTEFSVESGELTHDFKLRRGVIAHRYREVIEMLYRERY
jgi:long-chain acyl-CoA synthetase